jgi:PAS domain S-box-containing protein
MIDPNTFQHLPVFFPFLVAGSWVFIGISSILFIYSLVLFFYLKNFHYFYFFLYVLSINYLNLTMTGLGEIDIWGNFSALVNFSPQISYGIFVVFLILYTINFLNSKRNQKSIHIIDKCYFCSIIIVFIVSILYVLPFFNYFKPNIFLLFSMQLAIIINIIFLSLLNFKNLANKYVEANLSKKTLLLQELKIIDLFKEIFDGFWETDKEGNFKFISENIYEKLGYKKQEINFLRPDDLFASGAPDELKIQFRLIMSRHKSFKNIEIFSQSSNGEFKWFRASATVKLNEKSEFDGFIGALVDETYARHKQYEEYVNINTKSLARIAGSMAHEINNPLAYILLCIDSIINHEDSLEKKNHEKIRTNLLEMKKKILKISKIVSKLQGISLQGSEINKMECKISDIIHMAVKFCEYELKSLNISYSIEIGNNEEFIYVKKEEIYKALVNLIHNSIEATENIENPWIKISLKKESEDGISLIIMDNGEGIPFDKRVSIFEPFYTSKDFKKIGLGLTQSFQFVKRNGGILSLDLNAKYTEFSMRFKTIKKKNE